MTKETYIKELNKILKRTDTIEELERIKFEIQEEIINSKDYVTYTNGLMWCYEIIDKHVKEMKGDK